LTDILKCYLAERYHRPATHAATSRDLATLLAAHSEVDTKLWHALGDTCRTADAVKFASKPVERSQRNAAIQTITQLVECTRPAEASVWRWWRPPAALAYAATSLTGAKPKRAGLLRHRALLLLEALACASLIVALARPQRSIEVVPTTREGTDIIITLDYSNSMDAFDPPSEWDNETVRKAIVEQRIEDRLGVAREQIARFIQRRPNDRMGLVIFGHKSYVACPPTLDHDFLLAQVDQLTNSLLSMHERGTSLAAGLAASIRLLDDDEGERRRAILLITDGNNTIPHPEFTPIEAAELAQARDIVIHTVGIGSDDPYIPKHLKQMMRDKSFDTTALKNIAETALGQFFRPTDNAGFEAVMETIDALEKTSRVHPAVIFQQDRFALPLRIGAGLLLLGFVLQRSLLRTFP